MSKENGFQSKILATNQLQIDYAEELLSSVTYFDIIIVLHGHMSLLFNLFVSVCSVIPFFTLFLYLVFFLIIILSSVL